MKRNVVICLNTFTFVCYQAYFLFLEATGVIYFLWIILEILHIDNICTCYI